MIYLKKIALFPFFYLLVSCSNPVICDYEIENDISLHLITHTRDISLNDYLVSRTVTITHKKQKLTIELGESQRTAFWVKERKILAGNKKINSLWFHNTYDPGVSAINLDEMEILADSLLSKGMTNWCLCPGYFQISGDTCESQDCILIESCNLNNQ